MGKVTVLRQSSAGGRPLLRSLSLKIKTEVETKFRANPAMQTKVLEAKRREVVQVAQGYYGGLLKTIDGTLVNPNMRGFRTGGQMSRNVTVPTPNAAGLPQAVKAQIRGGGPYGGEGPWKALNERYREGKLPPVGVVSKSYWRKTGDLAWRFRIARLGMRLDSFGQYARTRLVQGNGSEYLAKMEMRIDFPAFPGDPRVDRLIRGSFASRVPYTHYIGASEVSRINPLSHLLLSESGPFSRPWIALFAAQMGVKYMEALKLLAAK